MIFVVIGWKLILVSVVAIDIDSALLCGDYFEFMQIVSELPAGTNWNFDVHWYPNIPGVISASSFDGKVGIYNIEVCFYIVFMVVVLDDTFFFIK